ncbi:MAG: class I SAM-dependent methyltransferase [Candidatus Kariarchaeaceae archaeon]
MTNKREKDFIKTNQANWDSRVALHLTSDYYQLEKFKTDPTHLSFVAHEHEEVGNVEGKTLLHLQCHFGLDTLSFARLGAKPTGTDISGEAIKLAQSLTQELDLDASFIQSDLYDLPDNLEGEFDIVFTSVGVLCWLPDIYSWAKVVAHFLKPGGLFYIKDGHPIKNIFDEDLNDGEMKIKFPYFRSSEIMWNDGASYASDEKIQDNATAYEWIHRFGDIINALIQAGLIITEVKEFPYLMMQMYDTFVKNDLGEWHFPNDQGLIPLMYTIKATKPLE